MLTDEDKAALMADMGVVTVPADAREEAPGAPEVVLPDGLVPWTWVPEQFEVLKAHRNDGSGRTKEECSAHNKQLYAQLQKARAQHNAAFKRRMKEEKVKVVSGEVARRVREANSNLEKSLELDDVMLAEVADKVLAALVKELS